MRGYMTEHSKTDFFLILFGCFVLLGASPQQNQQLGHHGPIPPASSSDSTQVFEPCSEFPGGGPSQGMELFGIVEPVGDPWDSYTKVALEGKVRELIQSTETIEILVGYDRNNQYHYSKRKAKETRREDIIFFGIEAEYFRYLLPPVQLEKKEVNQIKELLLGFDAYLEFGSGPKFSGGVITGPRFVVKVIKGDQEILVTISKNNVPSIWFSGDSVDPFGGLLHPGIESKWHQIIEAAVISAGYN